VKLATDIIYYAFQPTFVAESCLNVCVVLLCSLTSNNKKKWLYWIL